MNERVCNKLAHSDLGILGPFTAKAINNFFPHRNGSNHLRNDTLKGRRVATIVAVLPYSLHPPQTVVHHNPDCLSIKAGKFS